MVWSRPTVWRYATRPTRTRNMTLSVLSTNAARRVEKRGIGNSLTSGSDRSYVAATGPSRRAAAAHVRRDRSDNDIGHSARPMHRKIQSHTFGRDISEPLQGQQEFAAVPGTGF